MANREVLVLNETTPQIEAAQAGDVYLFPRAQINDGTIYIKEGANAAGDTAAYGQLWVKTATPNLLYFTDDAGTDFRVAMTSGSSTAVTATVGGGTTGLIPAAAEFVAITSDSAAKQVSLPAATGGKRLQLFCAATGCEVISAVAGDKVNNVIVGATNEAALVAGTLYSLTYDGVDNWVMTGLTNLGAVEAPVVPDAL